MAPIKVKYVISFSSEDEKHTVENLVWQRGPWLSHRSDQSGSLQADLQLEKATTISHIDIGNAGSMIVSMEVGRSSWPRDHPTTCLLPGTCFMSDEDWRAGRNKKTVRMFKTEDLDTAAVKCKWDTVKIRCKRPFRSKEQFGLSLLVLHTKTEQQEKMGGPSAAGEDTQVGPQEARDLLVARMNLPLAKKPTLPPSIARLEKNKLTDRDGNTSNNPALLSPTHPMSRAASLVSLASAPPSRKEAERSKMSLEKAALDFIISLRLTIADINRMRVIEVREKFEEKHQRTLTHEEKIIFRDITLDYSKRRYEEHERQQRRTQVTVKTPEREKNLQAETKEKSTNSSTQRSTRIGKYVFRRVNTEGSLQDTHSTAKRPNKNIQSPTSRIGVALADSVLTTPKGTSGPRGHKITPPRRGGQSHLDLTLSSHQAKKRKRPEQHDPFTAEQIVIDEDGSSDCEVVEVQDHSEEWEPSSTSKSCLKVDSPEWQSGATNRRTSNSSRHHDSGSGDDSSPPWHISRKSKVLGATTASKVGVAARGHTQASSATHMVECPMCSEFFLSAEVEAHADQCYPPSSLQPPSPAHRPQGATEECPVCGDQLPVSLLELHTQECIEANISSLE